MALDEAHRKISRCFVVQEIVQPGDSDIQVEARGCQLGIGGGVILPEVAPPIDENIIACLAAAARWYAGYEDDFFVEAAKPGGCGGRYMTATSSVPSNNR